ncbi:MAG: hypothetical protein MJK10_19050 [Pseudomonadales bacterium]|nr:hypothetical protein [Pseudomonadales bacterium]NRA18385.1 hypothetical protein [Oceanospirillaceae bacterium]
MLKNLLLTVTIALSLLVPTTQAVAAGIQHNNKRVHTPVLRKPIISPRRTVIRRAHWNNHSYNRGFYVAAGIVLGLVIADINSVPDTNVVSFEENGVTYFVVNGQKSVIVGGQFIAVN